MTGLSVRSAGNATLVSNMKITGYLLLSVVALISGTAMANTLDFEGCTVTTENATITYVGVEPVLTFTQNGSVTFSNEVRADVLVVGGGGGGGSAYYGSSSNKYNGNGGNGGTVKYAADETLSSDTTLNVVVGAAGAGGAGKSKGTAAVSGTNGGDSSFCVSSGKILSASGGAAGAGGNLQNYGKSGTAGEGAGTYDISGSSVVYGSGGQAAGSRKASDVKQANGQGGQGGYKSGTTSSRTGGAGGAGVVIVRLKEVLSPREVIEKPIAVTGLMYNGVAQTGVAADAHYTLSGTYQATNAGSYEATVTPKDGYCWPDKTHGAIALVWSIARRPVTVCVVSTNKVVGTEEPLYPTRAEGFVAGDDVEVSWKVWRTNLVEQTDGTRTLGEEIGTYDLLIAGTEQTTNYTMTYVNGHQAFAIRPTGPTLAAGEGEIAYDYDSHTVTVKPDDGVSAIEIVDMPDEACVYVPVSVDTIKGVTPNQVVVVAEVPREAATNQVDITAAFEIVGTESGVSIELTDDPTAQVTVEIAGKRETISVKPEWTAADDETVKPIAVDETEVTLGARTIPGLTYWLKRSPEPGGAAESVDHETAKGTRTKLTDPMTGGKPKQAFYVIEVTK